MIIRASTISNLLTALAKNNALRLELVLSFLIGIFFFLAPVTATADTRIYCQSELLKKELTDSWERAIYFTSSTFTVEALKDNKGLLYDPSLGKISCQLSETQIVCMKEEKGSSIVWNINRFTGVYESYFQTGLPGDKGTKTRGICGTKNQRRF
jgi:hypothetical protein